MAAIKGNDFASFLQTMNIGKESPKPDSSVRSVPTPDFDLDAAAKRALQFLLDRRGVGTSEELGRALELTPEQVQRTLEYVVGAGLVVRASGDTIELTAFGRDALGMYSAR